MTNELETIGTEIKEEAIAIYDKIAGNTGVQTVEATLESDWTLFVAKVTPLYNSLQTYAATTGRADLKALLSDLELGLGTAITSYLATGGNVGAAVAATAQAEIAKATADITADDKNALYGGLAIVASNLPQIGADPAAPAPEAPAAAPAFVAGS